MAKKASSAKTTPAKPAAAAQDPSATADGGLIKQALEAGEGLLRLAPTWVPRSFLMPGRRIKLAPQDVYALGAHRGGVDERWFASTPPAANDDREIDEGLSYIVHNNKSAMTLKKAIEIDGAKFVGPAIWKKYGKWPVY